MDEPSDVRTVFPDDEERDQGDEYALRDVVVTDGSEDREPDCDREERGEKNVHKEECLVDIRINAFIPEDYISNQAQRVDCYRKIARIKTQSDAEDITDELIDRFGDPPSSVVGLIEVARLRNMAADCHVSEISQTGEDLIFYMSKFDMQRLSAVTQAVGKKMRLETVGRPRMLVAAGKDKDALSVMKTVITAMYDAAEKNSGEQNA